MISLKFLLNNREFDNNISGKNWDWKIVTDEELREMLDSWEFGVFGNGFANVTVYALRYIGGHGCAYQVNVHYGKNGWRVADLEGRIFLKEESE